MIKTKKSRDHLIGPRHCSFISWWPAPTETLTVSRGNSGNTGWRYNTQGGNTGWGQQTFKPLSVGNQRRDWCGEYVPSIVPKLWCKHTHIRKLGKQKKKYNTCDMAAVWLNTCAVVESSWVKRQHKCQLLRDKQPENTGSSFYGGGGRPRQRDQLVVETAAASHVSIITVKWWCDGVKEQPKYKRRK